ncbi:MAG: hypothetical protein QOF76_3264 [Solirubrobacteraceae bacterium]|jgi:diguanylate cyclase (GGDEF)-like protein|nr:hypothetical protein [Solirubrobacteraceae bacterium]
MLSTVSDGRDPLTGALTRDRLNEELARALAGAQRYSEPASLCVIDLDSFRLVNEAHGPAAGDRLLRITADALAARLRATDLLGRLGADTFAIVLPRTDLDAARAVAAELLVAIRNGVYTHGGVRLTASAGVAGASGEALGAADVLARADLAMQGAKAAGRDRVVVAEAEFLEAESRARQTLNWAGELRDALETGGLDLHAQPIVAVAEELPPRYELLVRLRERPEVGSAEIIATAERFGQIQAVDGWVCARALDILTQTDDVVLHVNLAAASLGDGDLMAFLERAVRAAHVAPGRLVFEVTETAAINDLDSALTIFERLRALGCHLALDDFGSGFASFGYLKRFPFDILKIDGEFVRGLPDSLVDRLTVEAMANIARGLGMSVVAEYVTNDGTLAVLRELGIQYAQGFHCGAPAPASQTFSRD